MRMALFAFAMTLASGVAHAQWRVVAGEGDAGKERTTAVVENKEGHSLSIYRQPDGAVWARFTLAGKTPDQLAAAKPPVYQIDKNKPNDVADPMRAHGMMGLKSYAAEPKSVSFLIWTGKDEVRSDRMNQLMNGKAVSFQYYPASGGSKRTEFPLNGAGQAIARALDIPKKDKALAENREDFRLAFREVMKKCQREGADMNECANRAAACGVQPKSADLTTYLACVGE
jgi:hypothetical protein